MVLEQGETEDGAWEETAKTGTATEEVPVSHPRCPYPHQCTDTCSTKALQGQQRFLKKEYEMHPPYVERLITWHY